jgi:F0F1-type ATP synthase assembly protein I
VEEQFPAHLGAKDKKMLWQAYRIACTATARILQLPPMKLALAVLVYVLMGVVLGFGIILTVAGKPWFLIAAFIAYVVAFGKIGCMTH